MQEKLADSLHQQSRGEEKGREERRGGRIILHGLVLNHDCVLTKKGRRERETEKRKEGAREQPISGRARFNQLQGRSKTN